MTGARAAVILVGAVLSTATAQGGDWTISTIVAEGDVVAGVGLVTRIDNLAVNDDGDWIVEADTDHADDTADSVLLTPDGILIREGDPVDLPPGATVAAFDSVTLNNAGESAWNFVLDGTSGGNDDSGIYFGTTLVVQESAPAAAEGFSPGTIYIGFFDVKLNDGGHFVAVVSVDDPQVPSSVDRAIVILEDVGMGFPPALVAKETTILPGMSEGVEDFGTGPTETAINDAGTVVFYADLDGSTIVDETVWLYDHFTQGFTLLAREESDSPIRGRTWSSLDSTSVGINNAGDYVYRGVLNGDTFSDRLIVVNDQKFMQEGDPAPGAESYTLTSFGTGPLEIADDGSVLWYGDWNSPNPALDEGLFRGTQLVVQEGVTEVDGQVVAILRGIEDGYHMSTSGRYVIFEGVLADGAEAAFLIDFGVECPEDVNGDGAVNVLDMLAIFPVWGPCPGCPEDVTGDGQVNVADFLAVLQAFGPCG